MRRAISKPILLLIIVVVMGGAGALVWRKAVRDHVIPKNFGVVTPGKLYRAGGLTESAMRQVVKEHGIRTVVDLGAFDHEPLREAAMQKLSQELNVDRHTFRLKGDGTGNPNDYVAALRYLTDPSNQPALVMCSAGAQRTGAAVILYRCLTENQPIQQVYPESFEYRHDPGKDWKMLAFLADWSDEIMLAYRTGGWIAEQPQATELYAKPTSLTSGAAAGGDADPATSSASP